MRRGGCLCCRSRHGTSVQLIRVAKLFPRSSEDRSPVIECSPEADLCTVDFPDPILEAGPKAVACTPVVMEAADIAVLPWQENVLCTFMTAPPPAFAKRLDRTRATRACRRSSIPS